MKHLLILLSLLLLSAPLFGQSIVTKQVEETCYVSIDGAVMPPSEFSGKLMQDFEFAGDKMSEEDAAGKKIKL